MKGDKRNNRISSLYMALAAEFLEKEFQGRGMITVTGIEVSRDHKEVSVLLTIFPDQFESQALADAKRLRSDFREYVKSKTKNLAFCPTFDFVIDLGEKNRQKIDLLVQKNK